jgi:hypothetical protein
MFTVQELTDPVLSRQIGAACVVFGDEQILNGEHRSFLATFQLIFEVNQGAHHLILIHKIENDRMTFTFPETALNLYQPLFVPYRIENSRGLPDRPFYPVFGTNEDFNYWRELLSWDRPQSDGIL